MAPTSCVPTPQACKLCRICQETSFGFLLRFSYQLVSQIHKQLRCSKYPLRTNVPLLPQLRRCILHGLENCACKLQTVQPVFLNDFRSSFSHTGTSSCAAGINLLRSEVPLWLQHRLFRHHRLENCKQYARRRLLVFSYVFRTNLYLRFISNYVAVNIL